MTGRADPAANRIDRCFSGLRAAGRCGLIVYLTAGDPDLDTSLGLLHAAVAGGADIIELGYPGDDPVRDGPVIRAAHARALAAGGGIPATLELLRRFRAAGGDVPVVVMGYDAPLRDLGYAKVLAEIAAAGADGIIVADLELQAAQRDLLPALPPDLWTVPLGSPDLSPADVLAPTGQGGFLYCVPVAGPTGGPTPPMSNVVEQVARWRRASHLPVAVGFGIKTPENAAAVAEVADAVVVASALIARVAAWAAQGIAGDDLAARLTELVASYRVAIAGRSMARATTTRTSVNSG